MVICRQCGAESPDRFKFCGECGASLPSPVSARQTRKVVTALFCDVIDSTGLGERLDPELLREVINHYFSDLRTTIERHGGTVEKFIGDAVMAVFGIPRVHEDDALRAVRAAAEIHERAPALAEEIGIALRFRTGINTGLVMVGEGENLAIGDAVNVAARLEQAAGPEEIVLGHETLSLVRDAVSVEPLEPLRVKGKSEPIRAYRLLWVERRGRDRGRHREAPFVGRGEELRVLRAAFERAVSDRSCQLATLLGPAGIGKSRLVDELLSTVGETACVLQGRCLHYGEGITFWPLLEALAPIGDAAAGAVSLLSEGGAAVPNEMFWEVRRLLESVAEASPVVLHVDDLHWAEPLLLDLLDHVVEVSTGAPILVLATGRPELLESRPSWDSPKDNATTIALEPLDDTASGRLLDQLDVSLTAAQRARLVATADGNPLFLEEMAALTRDQGAVAVPPTIQALLAARLETLATEERVVLERGAIEGQVFHRLAVSALADVPRDDDVEPSLARLVRKELIRSHPPAIRGDAYRFRHLLIRDAAYDSLPKLVRADLHGRFAAWLNEVAADLSELDEIVGWHLEQAVRYHRELDRPPPPGLLAEAARHLHAAGQRAVARLDRPAALNLLRRALAVGPDDPRAPVISVELAEQMAETGEFSGVEELLDAVGHVPQVAARAMLVRLTLMRHTRPAELAEATRAAIPGVLDALAAAGDEAGLAKAHDALYYLDWVSGNVTAAAEEARLAAVHAEAADDEGLRSRALGRRLSTLTFGRYPASRLARELDAIEREGPGIYLTGMTLRGRACVDRFAGRFDEARRMWALWLDAAEAMGLRLAATISLEGLAEIELAAGDPRAALAVLRRAEAELSELGDASYRATVLAYQAEAHEQLGERSAARAAVSTAEALSAPDDSATFVLTNGVKARLALDEGDEDAAERWAREAVRLACTADFLLDEARARMNLGLVLKARSRRDAAEAEVRAALELYELKEDRPGAAAASRRLEQVLA